MKNKKIILIISIIAILLLTVGVSLAAYTYTRLGSNQELVLGDIYMHFNETNEITLTDAYPSETYDETSYFEFTISGKNTYTEKDIWYEIVLNHGDNHETRNTRIRDDLLKFTLVEIKDGVETKVIDNKSYSDLQNKRIYVNTIEKNTTSEVNATYRLYMWISSDTVIGNVNQDYTIDEWKDVYASVKVNVSGDFNEKIVVSELSTKEFKNMLLNDYSNYVIEEDGITYLSGTASDIDFNYVWYSGKLWRITSIDSNGSMKLITDDNITTIGYNLYKNVAFYTDESTNSYMYQWLNQDFLSTLYNYENIIETDASWYSLTTSSIDMKINSTADGITIYTAPVGLLNSYEYYMSYKNTSSSSGYLNIGYYWWLLNPYKDNYVSYVNRSGTYDYPSGAFGTRPSINLKSNVSFTGGDGTKTNSYKIVGDKEDVVANTILLNTRTSGEYVKFNGELYRIVSIEEDGKVKLNKNDYIKDTSGSVVKKAFASTITFDADGNTQTDDYWDYYLNNTWYNEISSEYRNMMIEGTYYLERVSDSDESYKNAICATVSSTISTSDCEKTTSTWTGFVGLPRYGEMFASQQGSGYSSSTTIWIINTYSGAQVWYVDNTGYNDKNLPSRENAARPSINLKSTVKITGGTGLKDDPYEISL